MKTQTVCIHFHLQVNNNRLNDKKKKCRTLYKQLLSHAFISLRAFILQNINHCLNVMCFIDSGEYLLKCDLSGLNDGAVLFTALNKTHLTSQSFNSTYDTSIYHAYIYTHRPLHGTPAQLLFHANF